MPPGRVILHLKVIKSKRLQNTTVSFTLRTPTPYFDLSSQSGALKIAKTLSHLVTGKAKSFILHVVAQPQGKKSQQTSTQVSVVIVPEYVGNEYVHSALQAINNQSRAERLFKQSPRDGSEGVPTEFSLHRIFRRSSPEAQRISKAELKFSRVLSEIKQEVANSLIGLYQVYSNLLPISPSAPKSSNRHFIFHRKCVRFPSRPSIVFSPYKPFCSQPISLGD